MSSKLSFKASDLLKEEEALARLRKKNYRIQFQKCLNVVNSAHKELHQQYTVYNIPLVLPGDPHFSLQECIAYLKDKLADAEFYVKLMQPGNVLLISWLPEHVRKVKKKKQQKENEKRATETQTSGNDNSNNNGNSGAGSSKDDEKTSSAQSKANEEVRHIVYQPTSALSNLSLRSSLMRDNPKYDHLKSMQKLKRRAKGSRARR